MASVRANQIAQKTFAVGGLEPIVLLGGSARDLTAEFDSVFRSSKFSIARLL